MGFKSNSFSTLHSICQCHSGRIETLHSLLTVRSPSGSHLKDPVRESYHHSVYGDMRTGEDAEPKFEKSQINLKICRRHQRMKKSWNIYRLWLGRACASGETRPVFELPSPHSPCTKPNIFDQRHLQKPGRILYSVVTYWKLPLRVPKWDPKMPPSAILLDVMPHILASTMKQEKETKMQ